MRTRSWRMRDTGRTVRTTIGDKPALCPLAQFSRQVHRLAPNIRTSPISRLGRVRTCRAGRQYSTRRRRTAILGHARRVMHDRPSQTKQSPTIRVSSRRCRAVGPCAGKAAKFLDLKLCEKIGSPPRPADQHDSDRCGACLKLALEVRVHRHRDQDGGDRANGCNAAPWMEPHA